MRWKEFFRPTIVKVVLAIFIFLILPIPFQEELCPICKCPIENPDCCPCEPTINFYYGHQFLLDDTPIDNDTILIFSNIGLIILSYIISCLLIFFIIKSKNKLY